jgi:hypothetical protein
MVTCSSDGSLACVWRFGFIGVAWRFSLLSTLKQLLESLERLALWINRNGTDMRKEFVFIDILQRSAQQHIITLQMLLVVDVDVDVDVDVVVVLRVVADHLNYIPPVDELTLPRPDRMSMRIVASAAIEEDPSMRAI